MNQNYQQQLRWANTHLKNYLLSQSVARWRRTPEIYQKLDRIYNYIVKQCLEELSINGKI